MRTLLPVLGIAFCVGCFRSDDLFVPEGDVTTVGVIIEAGQSEAFLLASHPHRVFGEGLPVVSATLSGPWWEAGFSDTVDLGWCRVFVPEQWAGPAVCLRAALPEPIEVGARYSLSGQAVNGSFEGATTVPPPPIVLEPADTVRLTSVKYREPAKINISTEESRLIHALTLDVANAFQLDQEGGRTRSDIIAFSPTDVIKVQREIQRIRVYGPWVAPGFTFDLYLLGLERNYGSFVQRVQEGVMRPPWHRFGLSGDEGVYGYFGAVTSSRAIHVVIAVPS